MVVVNAMVGGYEAMRMKERIGACFVLIDLACDGPDRWVYVRDDRPTNHPTVSRQRQSA